MTTSVHMSSWLVVGLLVASPAWAGSGEEYLIRKSAGTVAQSKATDPITGKTRYYREEVVFNPQTGESAKVKQEVDLDRLVQEQQQAQQQADNWLLRMKAYKQELDDFRALQ